MRSVLICHAGDAFDHRALAAWLASFTELSSIVVLRETATQKRARFKREWRRVGPLRFLDVVAMRLYQRAVLGRRETAWATSAVDRVVQRYGAAPAVPQIVASHVNDPAVVDFVRRARPDIVLARCKQLLKRALIELPTRGCFVMHPGVCPEYRNAHGCFWALAQRDLQRVGMTLLRVDPGIDTGPVYGYFSYPFDERRETYAIIQYRVVLENLDAIAQRFREIEAGSAQPIDVQGRASANWGQPWFTRYVAWRRAVRHAS